MLHPVFLQRRCKSAKCARVQRAAMCTASFRGKSPRQSHSPESAGRLGRLSARGWRSEHASPPSAGGSRPRFPSSEGSRKSSKSLVGVHGTLVWLGGNERFGRLTPTLLQIAVIIIFRGRSRSPGHRFFASQDAPDTDFSTPQSPRPFFRHCALDRLGADRLRLRLRAPAQAAELSTSLSGS